MASKKRPPIAQPTVQQSFNLLPAPQCAKDVIGLLKLSAEVAPAKSKMVTHLTEMGTLYPRELLDAFQAFLQRQVGDN
jgi:hypothetical protein